MSQQSVAGWLSRNRRTLLPFSILLLCLLVYFANHIIFVEVVQPGRLSTTDGDEPHYLMVTESIVTDHDISPMDNYLDRAYARKHFYEQELKPNVVFGEGGRLIFSNTRLFPYILAPGYRLFGYHGAAATMMLLTALAAMLVFLVVRKYTGDGIAYAATAAFFLTYPVLSYSRRVYPETAAMFLLALGLWSSLRLKESGKWPYALLAGCAAALMFQLHVKFATISVALLFLAWACSRTKVRDLLVWTAPVALSAIVLILWTWYLFGPDIVHGLTRTVAAGTVVGESSGWGIFGLYLDRAWGLFIFAPLYLAFIPGVPLARGWNDLKRWWIFVPLCIVLVTVPTGAFEGWHGGLAPVPRYLVPLLPVLILAAALFYSRCRSLAPKVIAGVLLLFQIVLTVFAAAYPASTFPIFGPANDLVPKILGYNFLSRWIVRLFPLFHPATLRTAVLPLIAWILVFAAVSIYLRRRAMDPMYEGLV